MTQLANQALHIVGDLSDDRSGVELSGDGDAIWGILQGILQGILLGGLRTLWWRWRVR